MKISNEFGFAPFFPRPSPDEVIPMETVLAHHHRFVSQLHTAGAKPPGGNRRAGKRPTGSAGSGGNDDECVLPSHA